MIDESQTRTLFGRMLAWGEAHVDFDGAVADIPAASRGTQPAGLPHSPWQLLEHLRITQHDILEFCRNPHYKEMAWPDDYWPKAAAPASDAEWEQSIAAFRRDREALQALAADPNIDLTSRIPHGSDQTYARELVLAADHTSYHVGQLVLVRRLLGIWKAD